jgi:hypothetical protein
MHFGQQVREIKEARFMISSPPAPNTQVVIEVKQSGCVDRYGIQLTGTDEVKGPWLTKEWAEYEAELMNGLVHDYKTNWS